ncbi:MAG: TIGR04211 family SH3 domain-containing protein [Pseudomonadota bacterium]
MNDSRRTNWRWLVAIGLLLSSLTAVGQQEQTAYVTDVLRLGLHRAADTSDRAFQSLESGQEVTVLSRDRLYANVRLPDGTVGYVKAGYLVDNKPARLIVEEVRAASADTEARLADVTARFSGSAERISSLENALADATANADTLREELSTISAANAEYEQRLKTYGFSFPWPIALGAVIVALALGFAGGYWWIDSRSRKRHGGFRIY